MHIVHLLTRLNRSGSEENTLATCQWQLDTGHDVTLIHGPDPDPFWNTNLPKGLHRIELPEMKHKIRPIYDARAVSRLRAIYRDLQPDVIHTHQTKAGILGRMASGSAPNAVVAHGVHIIPFENVPPLKSLLYTFAERMAARKTDVFISVSEATGRAFVDRGIMRRGRVHCVRSGMNLCQFKNPAWPSDWRSLLGVEDAQDRPKVILMMAAFEPRKRHIKFLESFARIAPKGVKVLLAGRGPQENAVRSAVAKLALEDHVVFCGHRPDPESLFALADVSLLTSEREGLPRVVVQSIAAGCPPIVQDLPGLEEILQHGKNGCVADPHDMDATVRHVIEVLHNQPLLEKLRKGTLETDLSAWNLEALGARTTALYGLPVRQPAKINEKINELLAA